MIDLLALGASSALDTFLIRLLSPSTPTKAGCAIGEDMSALARSYPALRAFQACSGLLDLRTVFVQHVRATELPVQLPHAVLQGHLLLLSPCTQSRCSPTACGSSSFVGQVPQWPQPLSFVNT